MIKIISAGTKWGDLPTCDHSVNMKQFWNPYRIPGLRDLTGLDPEVKAVVLGTNGVREAIQRAYRKALNSSGWDCTILFYCHAGHHRSVVGAEALARLLTDIEHTVEHRDLQRS